MKPIKTVIKYLFINAVLTVLLLIALIFLEEYDIVGESIVPLAIFIPIIIRLFMKQYMTFNIPIEKYKISTGIILLGLLVIYILVIEWLGYFTSSYGISLGNAEETLFAMLVFSYILIVVVEWSFGYSPYKKTVSISEAKKVINRDRLELLTELRKDKKLTSEQFEEEINKLLS
jgi:hypothetical protein